MLSLSSVWSDRLENVSERRFAVGIVRKGKGKYILETAA
jgi:hypothetical protein